MKKRPFFSIIIPCLNEEKFLPGLLSSIQDQDFSAYEIIVSDAGSKDDTRKIAKKFGCRITKGGLPSLGRNRGADAAAGIFLLFLDADTVLIDKSFLKELYKKITLKGADFGTCLAEPVDGTAFDRLMHTVSNIFIRLSELTSPHIWGPCCFFSREIFDRIKGFDEEMRIAEDVDAARRAAKHGKFACIPLNFGISTRRFRRHGYLDTIVLYVKIAFAGDLKKFAKNKEYAFYGEG